MAPTRNPHEGEPFTDDDDAIAAALADVSVPALLCSLVHMTGDPSWVRGTARPRVALASEVQGRMPEDEQADVRRRALPAIAAYRDGGCHPVALSRDLLHEMMEFLGCKPIEAGSLLEDMFFEDMQFDGGDSLAVTWGDEVPDDVKAANPVVVIGCGLSGILAGIRLTQAGLPFTIIEKNGGPGGTWWENRYPGARVDVGSHQYCYSFEPAYHWSEYYCQSPELRAYFAAILDKYGLRPHCRFSTTVTSVTWDEAAAKWRVGVQGPDGSEEELVAPFVISAVGSLNFPRMPDIPGMGSFEGPSFHSTRWPEDLDITGRRVAQIGAGATGFQIAPTIADRVERLTIFERTAQWIIPNPIYHATVPPGDRWAQQHLPFYARWFRFMMTFPGISIGTEPYKRDPSYQDETSTSVNATNAQRRDILLDWMKSVLADRPDLVDKCMPNYPAMGKRVLQDNGSWLRSLMKPNVELVRTQIERIEPHGVRTVDGTFYPADVICYATGFRHNEFLAPMEATGRNGVSLREQWGDEPTALFGISIPNFPNLFCCYGPGTNLAHGAGLFFHSEYQVHHALEAIRLVLTSGARTIEVRKDAHDDYVERYEKEIASLVWSHPAITHSHYKNPQGKVYTLSPWPLEYYREITRVVDPDDYVIE
jgi:4-hydroxyacetophenone monooxygenase